MVYELRLRSKYFHQVKEGIRAYEYRYNDKNFQVGDLLSLQEYNDLASACTGDQILVKVVSVCTEFVPEGYCIMGIKPVNPEDRCKYSFTGKTKTRDGIRLRQIINNITGEVGGWIESEKNLSQEGSCWVSSDAMVCGDAVVKDDAIVSGYAVVSDYATVCEDAFVVGFATIGGRAVISGNAKIQDRASVSGEAKVCDRSIIKHEAFIEDCAIVQGDSVIGGEVRLTERVVVTGAKIVADSCNFGGNSIIIDSKPLTLFVLKDNSIEIKQILLIGDES